MAIKIRTGASACRTFGQELCAIFGLEGQGVTNIAVVHRVNCIPQLIVTSNIMDKEKLDAVKLVSKRFRLLGKPTNPDAQSK